MDEARRILINLHTGLDQTLIVGLRQPIDRLLVRRSRRHDAHIHTPLGRQLQSSMHLIVRNQIRGENIDILSGGTDHIQIDILTHCLIVQRCVHIRLYDPLPRRPDGKMMPVSAVVFLRMARHIPHLQKHHREIPHGFTLDADSRILPVITVRTFIIDILVRHIDAAGIAYPAVDHHDLSVIPVVEHQCQKRNQPVKGHAFDPLLLDLLIVLFGQQKNAPHVVIDQPDLNTGFYLALQDLQHRIPHRALSQNKKLQKDKALRRLQILQQPLPPGKPVRIIDRPRMLPRRRFRVMKNIFTLIGNPRRGFLKPVHRPFILLQV